MKEVIITILAEDIYTSNYMDTNDCAMTRALRRAGLDMIEAGGVIFEKGTFEFYRNKVIDTPRELSIKVRSMYKYLNKVYGNDIEPIIPADFEYTLQFNT